MGKVVKAVKKVIKKTSPTAKLLGDNDEQKAKKVAESTPAAPAAVVEAPKEDADEDKEGTESAKKAARRGGKRGLSVARSQGGGLNI